MSATALVPRLAPHAPPRAQNAVPRPPTASLPPFTTPFPPRQALPPKHARSAWARKSWTPGRAPPQLCHHSPCGARAGRTMRERAQELAAARREEDGLILAPRGLAAATAVQAHSKKKKSRNMLTPNTMRLIADPVRNPQLTSARLVERTPVHVSAVWAAAAKQGQKVQKRRRVEKAGNRGQEQDELVMTRRGARPQAARSAVHGSLLLLFLSSSLPRTLLLYSALHPHREPASEPATRPRQAGRQAGRPRRRTAPRSRRGSDLLYLPGASQQPTGRAG